METTSEKENNLHQIDVSPEAFACAIGQKEEDRVDVLEVTALKLQSDATAADAF